MPILAPLKPMFDAMNAAGDAADPRPPAEARAAMHAMIDGSFGAFVTPEPPLPFERDIVIRVADGDITIRVYRPDAALDPALPCYLHFHGGGFWLGTLDQSDGSCRATARMAGCVVVSVDYRLAPEHKYPAAVEDCYAALLWVAAHAPEIGVDPTRLAIGGGSAGGNIAAVVAQMARDRGGPALALQVLEIPVTDFTRLGPLELPGEELTVASGKERYRDYYLADPAQALEPYASPLLAADLAGLPPALILCAQYDPLAREGEAYAERLSEAGVAVDYQCLEGQFHGSQNLATLIPDEAAAYRKTIVTALRRAFRTQA